MAAATMIWLGLGVILVLAVALAVSDVFRGDQSARPLRDPQALLGRRPTVAELREREQADARPYYPKPGGRS